jgi:iron(III) transport system permease protein
MANVDGATTSRAGARIRPTASLTAVFGVLVLLVLYPIATIVFNSFNVARPGAPAALGLDGWRAALAEPGMQRAVVNTIALVGAHTLLAMPTAVLIAWLLARTDLPARRWLEFLYWIPYFLPAFGVTMGWVMLLDPEFGLANDLWARWIGTSNGPFNIYSFGGIVWVHLVSTAIAVKVMLLTPLFRNLDAGLEEAARVCGASKRQTFARIVAPLMVPAMLLVLTLAVLHGLQTFEIELILGAPIRFEVYSTKIYNLLRQEPPVFAPATALSSLMLMAIIPLLAVQRRLAVRGRATFTGRGGSRTVRLGAWRYPALALVAGMCAVLTIVPLASLALGTFMTLFGYFHIDRPWTLDHWTRVIGDPLFLHGLRNTIVLGVGAAAAGLLLSSAVAYLSLRSKGVLAGGLDYLSWLPAALPGVLVGIGLLWVLGMPLFRPLYGTIGVLVVATAITSLTTCTQLVKGNLGQLGTEMEDAARVCGATFWSAFRTIVLPLMRPVLVLVAAIAFTHAARDISSVALVATAGSRPLALLQLDYLAAGQYESALVVATLLTLLSVVCAVVVRVHGAKLDFEP